MSPALRDDLWADSDEEAPDTQQELSREWEARRQRYYNSGYREGLDAGKADTIQQGFDAGFMQGSRAGYQYGQLKGALQSLALLGGRHVAPQAQQLLDQLSQVPTKRAAADICAALLQAPLEGDADALGRLTAAMQQLLSDGPEASASQDPGPGSAAAGELALQLQRHMQQQLAGLGHAPAPPPAPSTPAAAAAGSGPQPAGAQQPLVQQEGQQHSVQAGAEHDAVAQGCCQEGSACAKGGCQQQQPQAQQQPLDRTGLQQQEGAGLPQAAASQGEAAAAKPCEGCSCQQP